MKKLFTRCCVLLCAVLALSAAGCAREGGTEPPERDDLARAAAPKLALCGDPAWRAAVQWYYTDAVQARYPDTPIEEVLFPAEVADALDGLANGTYDAAILACGEDTLQQLAQYETLPLFNDAIVFIHGNPTPPDASYDLTTEDIRTIYSQGGALCWDEAQLEPLIPAYGYDDGDSPLWQQLSQLYDIVPSAPDILSTGEHGNPVWAAEASGRGGSPLFPCYYSDLLSDAGINGTVVSVGGAAPTASSIADGTYPLPLAFYGVYASGHSSAEEIAAVLQEIRDGMARQS